ncbi:MAG: tripartite tricarboxylate transporter substrate binding protein [Proteobacteria bacterium]|nr:tripartite tricarboxylate transporter substrate binding protein [Pseudomonadota bacterium]
MRKFLKLLAIGGILVLAALDAVAQYPVRPIRLIVPFVPGGPSDIVARPLAQMLGDALKTVVIVDNRPGAGGSIGTDIVAKSAADGYTLLMATVGTHGINPALYKKLPYDSVRDFTPIALIAAAPLAIVVNPSQPINDLAGLVALAKRMPGKISYGSAGNGTAHHLTGEMFKAAAGIDLQHVPYKGSPQALTDLIGGQIQVMFDPLQSVMAHIQSGKVRALAVSSAVRSPALPNVPTVAESGYKGFEATAWWGVLAPANLPTAQAAMLASEIERIARSSAFRDRLEPLGVLSTVLTLGAFGDFQRGELAKWGKAVRESGAAID